MVFNRGMSVCGTTRVRPPKGQFCTCVHDIEAEFDKEYLATGRGEILSATPMCSCGYKVTFTDRCTALPNCRYRRSSGKITVALIRAVHHHWPLFLAGHDCCGYDNVALLYHLSLDM